MKTAVRSPHNPTFISISKTSLFRATGIFLLTFLCFAQAFAQAPFQRFQGFEGTPNDNWAYTISPTPYNTNVGADPQIGQAGYKVWAIMKQFSGLFGPATGNFFMASGDYTSGGWHEVNFPAVDISSVQNASLSFKYITYNLSSQDEIEYSISYNNGGTWGNSIPLNKNNQSWQSVSMNIPANAQWLRLRLRAKQVNGLVCGGFDDILLTGTQPVPTTITTGLVNGSYCAGQSGSIAIPFTTTGYYNPSNTFVAQLSNANGQFNNPTTIGTLSHYGNNPAATITANLPNNLSPGSNYQVRIVSTSPVATGNASGPITVNQVSAQLSAPTFSGGHHISCPSAQDGSINVWGQTGVGPYTYQWTGPNGFSSSSQNISGLGAGTYSLNLTDQNGCSTQLGITLTAPNLSLVVLPTNITCNGQQDGQITAQVTGSAPPFTASWTGPNSYSGSGLSISGLAAGNYQVTVTDANGCTTSGAASIAEPVSMTISATVPVLGCGYEISCHNGSDGSIDLSVSGGKHTLYV